MLEIIFDFIILNLCLLQIIDIAGPFIKQIKAENTCDIENYSPCECSAIIAEFDLNHIKCTNVEISDVSDIFNRTHAIEVSDITFYMKEEYEFIPDNWISDKKCAKLYFYCGSVNRKTIAIDAFHSTQNYTSLFEISNCLLQDSDLSFINGFTQLSSLKISQIHEIGRLFSTFQMNVHTKEI